ncbi:MAG: radical SAM protein, partial [Clostridia bacterium]
TRGALNAIADIDYTMYCSLMCQYFPTAGVKGHGKLDRRLTQDEYDKATEYFFSAGLKNGFSQELESAKEEYVPSFDLDALKKIV